jgi:hypothetical protein
MFSRWHIVRHAIAQIVNPSIVKYPRVPAVLPNSLVEGHLTGSQRQNGPGRKDIPNIGRHQKRWENQDQPPFFKGVAEAVAKGQKEINDKH